MQYGRLVVVPFARPGRFAINTRCDRPLLLPGAFWRAWPPEECYADNRVAIPGIATRNPHAPIPAFMVMSRFLCTYLEWQRIDTPQRRS